MRYRSNKYFTMSMSADHGWFFCINIHETAITSAVELIRRALRLS